MMGRRSHDDMMAALARAGDPPKSSSFKGHEDGWLSEQDRWYRLWVDDESIALPGSGGPGSEASKARAAAWKAVLMQHARAALAARADRGEAAALAARLLRADDERRRSKGKKHVRPADDSKQATARRTRLRQIQKEQRQAQDGLTTR